MNITQHLQTSLVRAGILTAAAVTGLAGCGIAAGSDTDSGTDPNKDGWHESGSALEAGVSPVLFLGDSVAAGEAAALTQAVAASGAKFVDATSTGGGNVVGPNAQAQWKKLPRTLAEADGGVVVYQLTTYDWGTAEQQRAAYERLASETAEAGADLVLVSMPPIKADAFYKPHMDELAGAAEVARDVAEDGEGIEFLDASEVWGQTYQRKHAGEIDRSKDGIHTCPQGAARFADWLLGELADLHPGFEPADAEEWANTGWTSDKRFHGC
ncbi:MAG: SGNH/GDSL hydrolase family protein [Nocardioides sp.]|uniref:SGNH/GDSL hydrolase family protein n=1 Tax=Nocardioides sp. TaxID=35761 RepID=UPI003D6A6D04